MTRRTEAAFWSYLSDVMSPYWAAQRHEDRYTKGIPDVSYSMSRVNGWIELKSITVDLKSIIKIPHFTNDQRQWLKRHGRRGGNCYLFIEANHKTNRTYILIPHNRIDVVGESNFLQLLEAAQYYSDNRIDVGRLIKALL
jgi:hypothetical protein